MHRTFISNPFLGLFGASEISRTFLYSMPIRIANVKKVLLSVRKLLNTRQPGRVREVRAVGKARHLRGSLFYAL